ncbi:zinc transporter ZIP3 [Brachyhypopomus gauderio]|uniref:zinc transporter ZIP3 n=1 Tax=Brachyhypopomus gauderio TaxID=698409 RepID=UPI004042782F
MPSAPVPPATVSGFDLELGSMCLLFSSTVLFGVAPFWLVSGTVRWGLYPETRHRVLALLSCSAAGVLLASCLLDVVPTYLAGMTETFRGLGVTLCFPVPEFILAVGFLLVLLLEQVLLALREQPDKHTEEKSALLAGGSLGSHDQLCAKSSSQCSRAVARAWPEPCRGRSSGERAGDVSLAAVRAFVLVFSLCLCSVLEAVARGEWLDLLLRNGLLALSLALRLTQSQLRRVVLAACVLLFSAMAPLGVVLGATLRQTHLVLQYQLARSTLQGLAAGSFTYIVFMEVLPHALNTRGQRIPKVTLLLTGFSAITAVLFIKLK